MQHDKFNSSASKKSAPHFLIYLCTFLFLASCDLKIHGEDSLQKKRGIELVALIVENFKEPYLFSRANLISLFSYAIQCQQKDIPQQKCVQLVVLSEDILDAAKRTAAIAEFAKKSDLLKNYKGVWIVLIPAERNKSYAGDVTPHSISQPENFLIGKSIVLKIGE